MSASVTSTGMDAFGYRTKCVGRLWWTPATAQLLVAMPTPNIVQLLPSARWTRNPHPSVSDTCRLLGFAVNLQEVLSRELPSPVIPSRKHQDAAQTRHGLLLETDLVVFPGSRAFLTCVQAPGGRARSCGRMASFWRRPALEEPDSELTP